MQLDFLSQASTFYIIHGKVEDAGALANFMNLDYVCVLQARGRLRLLMETSQFSGRA